MMGHTSSYSLGFEYAHQQRQQRDAMLVLPCRTTSPAPDRTDFELVLAQLRLLAPHAAPDALRAGVLDGIGAGGRRSR